LKAIECDEGVGFQMNLLLGQSFEHLQQPLVPKKVTVLDHL